MTKSLLALLLGASLFVVGALPARADAQSKAAKIKELFQLQGRVENLKRMLEGTKAEIEKQRDALIAQYKQQYPDLPSPYWDRFSQTYDEVTQKTILDFSAEDATSLYGELLGAELSEEDLDQIIAFDKSPVGQKAIKASHDVGPKWQAALHDKYRALLIQRQGDFIKEMAALRQECVRTQRTQVGLCAKPAQNHNGI